MLNLLPKDYKDKVRREYIRRFLIVMLMGLSIIDIFLIVAVFPMYSSIITRNKIVVEEKKALEGSSRAKDRDPVLKNVKDLESKLKIMETVPGEKPTEYIDDALLLKGEGIHIQSISYIKKSNTQKVISFNGVASSRTSLIEFSKRVKGSNWATTSDIPISNLAGDKNINFLVTLTATSTPK
jgi:hypothetical protein